MEPKDFLLYASPLTHKSWSLLILGNCATAKKKVWFWQQEVNSEVSIFYLMTRRQHKIFQNFPPPGFMFLFQCGLENIGGRTLFWSLQNSFCSVRLERLPCWGLQIHGLESGECLPEPSGPSKASPLSPTEPSEFPTSSKYSGVLTKSSVKSGQ